MSKTNSDQNWPSFRGRRLTAKEISSGLVITPLFYKGDDPQTYYPSFIPRNQVWVGENARIFIELRFGRPPLETHGNKSILTGARFCELDPAMQSNPKEAGEPSTDVEPIDVPPGHLKRITLAKVSSIRPGAWL